MCYTYGSPSGNLISINNTVYKKIEIKEHILEQAEKITLRDLLDSPAAQAWIVSALGNIARFRTKFEGHDTERDEYLQFLLSKVGQQMGYEERSDCYHATGAIIRGVMTEKAK